MSKDQSGDSLRTPFFNQVIVFECVTGVKSALSHPCFYDVIDWRSPKAGEWFLDGPSLTHAVRAKQDFALTAEYWIARPTNYAMKTWYKGERVEVS